MSGHTPWSEIKHKKQERKRRELINILYSIECCWNTGSEYEYEGLEELGEYGAEILLDALKEKGYSILSNKEIEELRNKLPEGITWGDIEGEQGLR